MLSRRELLRDFLKTRRARLKPQDIGSPQTATVRRTPGLRRSEIARHAGMSAEWYTFFEIGKPRALTPHSADAICEALSLSAAERDYLYDLALPAAGDVILIAYDRWLTTTKPARSTPTLRSPILATALFGRCGHGSKFQGLREQVSAS